MGTKNCRHCAEEILDKATTCKHCGRSQAAARPWAWGCLFAFAFVIGVLALVETSTDTENTTDPRPGIANQWLRQSGLGNVTFSRTLPDWENGSRLGVQTSQEEGYIFYFSNTGQICSVWEQQPREKIFQAKACN